MTKRITPEQQLKWELELNRVMKGGFEEAVNITTEWLNSPRAREYFFEQQGRLHTFFTQSGINKQWNEIIERRALQGVDVIEEIYEYARKVNMENHLVPYTATEKAAMNRLCDYNYELIKNVTQDEITAIRRKLVQDYAEGRHPSRTGLKELELQPINGFSPRARAEMISRTESARTLNVSTLETLRNDGIEYVILYGCDTSKCDICAKYNEKPIPIEEALEIEVPHPNCTGVWVSAHNPNQTQQ